MFTNTEYTTDDDINVRIRFDGSVELSHMNDQGFRHSKVYYFAANVEECIDDYKYENNMIEEI